MARKPARPSRSRTSTSTSTSAGEPPRTDRERIIEAFMALLGEQSIEAIGFGDIAARAGVSLVQLRDEFASKLRIYAAHVKAIDRKVLAGGDADLAEEPARERLFDVLMRRLEALAPYRPAIRSLLRSARRYPGLALALNAIAVNSQQWMLTAANVPASGPRGMMRAQGLAVLFAGVLRTFVHDDDDGLARTMAALDRALARGQRWANLLEDVCSIVPCRLPGLRRRRGRRYRDEDFDRDAGEEPIPV